MEYTPLKYGKIKTSSKPFFYRLHYDILIIVYQNHPHHFQIVVLLQNYHLGSPQYFCCHTLWLLFVLNSRLLRQ